MEPISVHAIQEEFRLVESGSSGEYLLQPLKTAKQDGRLLMGWSRHRAKDRTLTWAAWDAFVERWCGKVECRSPLRTDAFDSDIMFEEVRVLTAQRFFLPVGRMSELAKPKAESPAKKRSRRGADGDDED
jgi:hypothetical protein